MERENLELEKCWIPPASHHRRVGSKQKYKNTKQIYQETVGFPSIPSPHVLYSTAPQYVKTHTQTDYSTDGLCVL